MALYIDNLVSEGGLQHQSWNTGTLVTTVSASTQSLTVASVTTQVYSGAVSGQIVKMPDCTTFAQIGQRYQLHNDSTQNVTVQDNGATQLFLLGPTQRAFMVCTSVGSAAGTWSWILADKNVNGSDQFLTTYPGTGLSVNYLGGNVNFNGTSYAIAGGSIALTASVTGGWIYVDPTSHAVSQAASLPDGAVPLYQFTTTGSAVSVLTDFRQDVMEETVWGQIGDISGLVYNSSKSAGTLNRYARADHNHGISVPLYKSGVIASGTFSGSPKTASVVFGTAFPSTPNVVVTGADARSWTITASSTTGFTVSANASQALTGSVYWIAHITGEST